MRETRGAILKTQIIHSISTVQSRRNNYSKVNVIETRRSDNFDLGEFEGTDVRLKLRFKNAVIDKMASYNFSEGSEQSYCVPYERSRILIDADIIKEDPNDLDLNAFRVLGTDKTLSGVRIILKAIPNEHFQDRHTEAYLSEYGTPYLNANNLNFPYLTFKIHIPAAEITRHIAEIEAGNSAAYEIDFDEGVYKHVDRSIHEYRLFPDRKTIYDEIDMLKPLLSVRSFRVEYRTVKKSFFETIRQKLGF